MEYCVSRLSMIRIIGKFYLMMSIATIFSYSCTSCIHDNSWQFRVKNQTEDTLLITTESIIPDFGVQVNNQGSRGQVFDPACNKRQFFSFL